MTVFHRSLGLALLFFNLVAMPAGAVDIGIAARSLTITDKTPSGGKAKLTFVARDPAVTKGSGTDLDQIEVSLRVQWFSVDGGFQVPAGARPFGAATGWTQNDARTAKFVNANADLGVPTAVKSFSLSNGRGAKWIARSAGDDLIALLGTEPPSHGFRTVFTVTNGGETFRYCTRFHAEGVERRFLNGGGVKLIAKRGVPAPCPEDPMQLSPLPALPPAPSAPSLWFDGNDPNAVAEVLARTSDPETSGLYASIRAVVDGSLASLNSASDDTRTIVAKGAGLLHVVGAVPPPASGYASYRDIVVAALLGVGDRTATDTIDEFFMPPANLLDVLRDAGRLQSMAEAFDFVRGAGIDPGDESAITDRIANWADEYLLDWNLLGDPFGLFDGHRDNWAIKAGSALVTTALALPDHPSAAAWLDQGVAWINESLAVIVRPPGWYAESAHYLNYTLNNLVSAAWHLRNAADTEWFDDLEPLVDMAFLLRQPDGRQPPFEEGVSNTFPWDVLAAAYPQRSATMLWALANSPGDFSAYDNQQFHSVTRFLVKAIGVTAETPSDPPTGFADGDTHAIALRSSWNADAFQLTGITASDTSYFETVPSRHHMQNPLDVVLHGAGSLLMPTASGGPTVTTSPNRSYYLLPSSKNIPLVDGDAPYVVEPLAIEFGDAIDSRDSGALPHRLLDAATSSVASFTEGVNVSRTLAMVGDRYGVVIDRFESVATHDYDLTWRGRGDGTLRTSAANHVAADYDWPNSGAATARLAVDVTSSSLLNGALGAGKYATTFGAEEDLEPLNVGTQGSDVSMLSVLFPRPAGDPAATFAPLASTGGVAATLSDGPIVDTLLAGIESTNKTAAGIESDGRFALVRKTSGATTGLAALRATRVAAGTAMISANQTAAFAASLSAGTVVLTLASTSGPTALTLEQLPGLSSSPNHSATFDGVPVLPMNLVDEGTRITVTVPGPGVLVVSNP